MEKGSKQNVICNTLCTFLQTESIFFCLGDFPHRMRRDFDVRHLSFVELLVCQVFCPRIIGLKRSIDITSLAGASIVSGLLTQWYSPSLLIDSFDAALLFSIQQGRNYLGCLF